MGMNPLAEPALPASRGPLSEFLLATLQRPPHALGPAPEGDDPLTGEDLHLTLYCCYELHYRGLAGVHEGWEWEPSLLALRAAMEARFEAALRAAVPRPQAPAPEEMDLALRRVIEADGGPALSRRIETRATHQELLEYLVHRSANLLKEADPYSFAIARLTGTPKAAMVEILADEYGGGRPERVHATLFADEMAAVGLDPTYGAYLDHTPGVTLAAVNLASMLGLHRRHRGAIVGHLAVTEMTSSLPNRRYGNGLRRLGHGDATAYHDEHVVADAIHESIAAVDLAGGLARQDPRLGADVLWGAACLLDVEARFGRHVETAWDAGESSLRAPLAPVVGAAA